jgi:hypothetical protein
MTNQEIINALENDGFLVTTFVDTKEFEEEIIFSKKGIYGKVDSTINIRGLENIDLLVTLANLDLVETKSAFDRIKKSLKLNSKGNQL